MLTQNEGEVMLCVAYCRATGCEIRIGRRVVRSAEGARRIRRIVIDLNILRSRTGFEEVYRVLWEKV